MRLFRLKQILRILILIPLFLLYKVFRLFGFKREMVVLMYHSVNDTEFFAKQIRYLKNKNYYFLTAEELSKELSNPPLGNPVSKWPKPYLATGLLSMVLLTFDDGYADFMANVLPVLEKEQVPAAVFAHTNRSSENFSHRLPLMNWDEIRTLKRKGVEIGNHSHSHPNLKNLSREELQMEIKSSEEIFLKEVGFIPKIFAYPAGKYNQQVAEVLRENGYSLAFTIDEGMVVSGDDPLKIKRIGIDSQTTWLEFCLKLTPAFGWYQKIRIKKR